MSPTRESHGRTFHNTDSNYKLPNDEVELARLNCQHDALKLMTGTNYQAPLHNYAGGPKNILDICCGSGLWAIEMAEEFPNAEVIGIDLCVPPLYVQVPSNCKFIEGDVTKPLPFPDEIFDIVQLRIVPSLSNTKTILREIGRVLRTGGYVEFVEPAESYSQSMHGHRAPAAVELDRLTSLIPHSSSTWENPDTQDDLPKKKGWSSGPILADMIRLSTDAKGHKIFHNVESKVYGLPMGPWPTDERPKRIAALMSENQVAVLDGFRPALFEHNIVTEKYFDSFRQALAAEVNNGRLQQLVPYWFAWGKKVSGTD